VSGLEHRIVLHVSTRRDGRVLYELRDETIGRSLLMADCSPEMAEYAVRGELLLVMETPEARNAQVDRLTSESSRRSE